MGVPVSDLPSRSGYTAGSCIGARASTHKLIHGRLCLCLTPEQRQIEDKLVETESMGEEAEQPALQVIVLVSSPSLSYPSELQAGESRRRSAGSYVMLD